MTSNKQLLANRANARRSTGPKTESGKARASNNAIKHGLTATSSIIDGEDPAEFERLRRGLEVEFGPGSEFERRLVLRVSQLLWRLRRGAAFEAGLLLARASGMKPEEGLSPEQLRREKMAEISARFASSPNRPVEAISPPPSTKTKIKDERDYPNQRFWRKVGVALTRDSQFLDALASLSRHEGQLVQQVSGTVSILRSSWALGQKGPLNLDSNVRTVTTEHRFAHLVVGDEEATKLASLRAAMRSQYGFRSTMQLELLDYISGLLWRLDRIPRLEAALMEVLADKVAPPRSH